MATLTRRPLSDDAQGCYSNRCSLTKLERCAQLEYSRIL